MKLQVLISTMHQHDHSLLDKMNIRSDAVVVNQCDINKTEQFYINNSYIIKWINSTERGLSRSRNTAIENSVREIGLLADDDLEYINGYEKIILTQFERYSEVDIIAFQVEGIEKPYKRYYKKTRNINYVTSMKISSVEIAFRLDSIRESNIRFNELFGAGSEFFMGEENIFLFNCLRHGLRIMYVPVKIANLHIGQSTWFNGFNKEYFISRGAVFTAMSKNFSMVFIIQFAIRKYGLYCDEFTVIEAVKSMMEGRKRYLKDFEGWD